MTTSTIVPMTLGDIFDRLFKLIGKTWIRNLILASIILIIPVIIMSFGVEAMFSSIAAIAKQNETGNPLSPEELFSMFGGMAWSCLGFLAILVGSAAATLGVTMVGCAETSGLTMTWQEALKRSFGVRLARLLGLYIVQGAVFIALFFPPYILLIIAIATRSIALGLLAGLLLFACVLVVIFLFIRWAFTVPAIAWEDLHIMNGFRRSWALVKDHWWRVFGILLLMGIMLSFAVSLIMTPVYVAALWKFFTSYFDTIGSMGSRQIDPSVFLEGFSSVGFAIGLASGLGSLLQMLVAPLYVVVLYFDLRARKNEFSGESASEVQPLV